MTFTYRWFKRAFKEEFGAAIVMKKTEAGGGARGGDGNPTRRVTGFNSTCEHVAMPRAQSL